MCYEKEIFPDNIMSISEGDFPSFNCDICHNSGSSKSVCSDCVYNLLMSFQQKEEFCKEHGDPIQIIATKLKEHADAINKIHEILNNAIHHQNQD